MRLLRTLCERLAARLPKVVIPGADGSTYLERHTLVDFGHAVGRVYLHHFHRGDEDRELHNHPWYGLSWILVGGYREERRRWAPEGEHVVTRDVRPGQLNVLFPFTFHRVDLLDGPCWTLFLTGPVVQSWGFWNRTTGRYLPWREFVRKKEKVSRLRDALDRGDRITARLDELRALKHGWCEGTGEPVAESALRAAERYARHAARDEDVALFPTVEGGVSVDTASAFWHFAPNGSATLVEEETP